jgi:signal transduction histidine kinase
MAEVGGHVGRFLRRKRAAHDRGELLAREQAARARAESAERRLTVLSEIARSISASLDLDIVLQRILHGAKELCSSDSGAIFLREEGSATFGARYRTGVGPEVHDTVQIQPGRGAGGQVLIAGRPFRTVDDPAGVRIDEPGDTVARDGTVALMVVPIVIAADIEGLLYLSNRSRRAFTDEDEAICVRLADQAAVAIRNAHLFAREQTARAQAEELATVARTLTEGLDVDAIGERVVESVLGLFGARAASLRLIRDDGALVGVAFGGLMQEWFAPGHVLPPGPNSLSGRAVIEGRAVWSTDVFSDPALALAPDVKKGMTTAGDGAVVAVPLRAKDRLLGAVSVADRAGRRFTDAEIGLLQAFADQAALAMERARLFEEAEQRRRDAEAARAEAEAARAEAEAANRAKDEFLAIVSHELRTPLTAMLGWSRMLRKGGLGPPQTARALEAIERNTDLQVQLINDLLDVSRIVTGKLDLDRRPLDLTTVVDMAIDSVQEAARKKGLDVRRTFGADAVIVDADPTRLHQVLWNLLTNAIKFTPDGGRVDLRLAGGNGRAVLTVTDTGGGIAPEALPYIFERFRQADSGPTRNHGGLGLGLAIVKYLVELHGGTVTAASDGIGMGTTFVVSLPLAADGDRVQAPRFAGPDHASRITELPALIGVRVLLVDDEADSREILTAVLAAQKATVKAVGSADEALALLRTFGPDVLVSDVRMPDKDGYALIRELRAHEGDRQPRLPAVALTAYATYDDHQRAIMAGFDVHLGKPVEPLALARMVGVLARRRPGRLGGEPA